MGYLLNELQETPKADLMGLIAWQNTQSPGIRASIGISLTPDTGPNPHFLEKRVSGSKNSHFPSFWKREFSVKKSPFFFLQGNTSKMGIFFLRA